MNAQVRHLMLTFHKSIRTTPGIEALAVCHVYADRTATCAWRADAAALDPEVQRRLQAARDRVLKRAVPGRGRIAVVETWSGPGADPAHGSDR